MTDNGEEHALGHVVSSPATTALVVHDADCDNVAVDRHAWTAEELEPMLRSWRLADRAQLVGTGFFSAVYLAMFLGWGPPLTTVNVLWSSVIMLVGLFATQRGAHKLKLDEAQALGMTLDQAKRVLRSAVKEELKPRLSAASDAERRETLRRAIDPQADDVGSQGE